MRKGMKVIGHTKEEIDAATNDVQNSDSYEEALKRIAKYFK